MLFSFSNDEFKPKFVRKYEPISEEEEEDGADGKNLGGRPVKEVIFV